MTTKNRKDLIESLTRERDPRPSKIKLCIKCRLSWALWFKFYENLEEVLPLVDVKVLSAPGARPDGVALKVVEEVHIGAVAATQAMLELGQKLKGIPNELCKLCGGPYGYNPAKEKALALTHP